MILDTAKYAGPCDCGRVHELRTKLVVCEYGAMDKFDDYMAECGLSGFRTVIYDTNTCLLYTSGANYCNSQLLVRHVRLHQSTSLMATGLSSAMDLRAAKLTAKLLRLSETLGTHPALPSSWPFMSCSTPALSLPGK